MDIALLAIANNINQVANVRDTERSHIEVSTALAHLQRNLSAAPAVCLLESGRKSAGAVRATEFLAIHA